MRARRLTASANRRRLLLLGVVFVASRVVVHVIGLSFDTSELTGPVPAFQLLPAHLLRTDLLSSVWHLHSQPPLWNLVSGLLIRLPAPWLTDVPLVAFAGLGLVLVLSTYQAMVDLHVPPWLAWVAAALVAVSPASILYESWLFYAYPTATALAFVVCCGVRYLRTQRWPWGFGFFASAAAVVLLNSTYQVEWFVALGVVVGIALRARWRSVLAVAALPAVLVGGWYVKDAVQFGTFTTSSWLGMNLAKTTLVAAPPGLVARLVARGTLTPLAEVGPFSPVASYDPRFVRVAPTGVAALDETGSGGGANYNNLVYVQVSRLYLSDDLDFVAAEPGRYLATVAKAGAVWFVPTDEYFGRQPLAGWSRLYDAIVLLTPGKDRVAAFHAAKRQGPGASQVSYTSLAGTAIVILGVPLVGWRRRRSDPALVAALVIMWLTALYALAATSLVEFAENQRFHFESGPLVTVAALVVLAAAIGDRKWRTLGAIPRSSSPP